MKTSILLFVMAWLSQCPAIAGEGHDHGDSHGDHSSSNHHNEEEPHHDNDEDHDEQTDDHHGHDDEHDEALNTRIDPKIAKQVGIKTARASSQVLSQRIVVYGSLSSGPEQLSHIRARYSGLIKSVKPTIGDEIKRGELLAEVESNESLKSYRILSPISGTIIQRHANTGEVTRDQVLFSIANFDTLWAEFRLYPTQQKSVKAGQPVRVVIDSWEISSSIQHIVPALDRPYQLARVKFDNREKGLTAGLLSEGQIVIGEFTVDIAVEKAAIQTLGNQPGVFLHSGNKYEFTPLSLGRSDDRYTEVIAGLTPGQRYVNDNSYLIKADIEKSEAEHEH